MHILDDELDLTIDRLSEHELVELAPAGNCSSCSSCSSSCGGSGGGADGGFTVTGGA